ncbi:MAG TPA: phosphatidylglycerophosphatase A [Bacilli bacterium]|nr:phosphatidylglycerophosphatase A [Bacilli bacterium]
MKPKLYYNREEMFALNRDVLLQRGVTIKEIAEIAFNQQARYNKNIEMKLCIESVEKILTFRDIFHHIQLAAEIDRMAEEGLFRGPIQDILKYDLGVFGIDEVLGLDIARLYGAIGQTNFGDIDVNKPGVVARLNSDGKQSSNTGKCHTFMDDIVGALAAAASTRVAQIMSENEAFKDPHFETIQFDI